MGDSLSYLDNLLTTSIPSFPSLSVERDKPQEKSFPYKVYSAFFY